jgi:hypothetical protein
MKPEASVATKPINLKKKKNKSIKNQTHFIKNSIETKIDI